MKQKKYVDIERCKECYAENFKIGEHIIIEEKIDFANSSFRYDIETNSLKAFSRRKELNESNTLNGFWNWVQQLPLDIVKDVIGSRYIIFGEWSGNPHKVNYPDYVKNNFWMFDVWDTETEQYLQIQDSLNIYNKLKLYIKKFVPIFYDGKFISWEHVMSFVGRSDIGASPCGEGIVIKRQDNLDSKSSYNPFYVKIVSEKFSEIKSQKKHIDNKKITERKVELENVAMIVTSQRIEKMLFKLIDEQIIPSNWNEKNMNDIAKILPKEILNDCMKEEPEIVLSCDNFYKLCSSITMQYIRKLLNKK